MTKAFVLWLMVIVQTVFLAWTLLFLVVARARRWSERKAEARAREFLAEPTRQVMLGEATVTVLAQALRQLTPRIAARHLMDLAGSRLSPDVRDALATMVRGDAWVANVLIHASSRWWWRRLDAARLLAVVAGEHDAPIVERMLLDPHAAVVSAITPALARAVHPRLIAAVLDTMHRRPAAVRLQQGATLRHHWQIAEPLLAERLRRGADAARLRFWIELADTLDSPVCLIEALRFSSHPSAEVRIAAARAYGKCFDPDAVTALLRMLRDPDWRIRVQAARSLGALRTEAAIDPLVAAMTDESWWVRFRAALALATLGETGCDELRRISGSDDEFTRDMAQFVEGLPEGSRIELSAQ